ncbi:tol-pal system-associated acyl-CoA thioesterase [Salinicola acroporae]|uniref:Tol-pal system-associated acyl-CoA thioesterase n=1 Tax=Salinicola acroporae TaxID=1541440 RepID=A0ABT6I653_9GAMM|nr:tol-pal system-associated acyl-CoA thioesterase [Salinicola acroporae]MDH4573199.1 tol-pal system-associated acyl-CoA thioesterase [Salinicola acroporae]
MNEFILPVKVYIEDTDAGGIVYYVNYLKFMERARSEWLNALGFGQRGLIEQGVQLVVHSLQCRYARPARLDDRLEVTASIDRLAACTLRFAQAVRYDGDTLCEASVDIACVDAQRLKPRRWPSNLHAALTSAIPSQ